MRCRRVCSSLFDRFCNIVDKVSFISVRNSDEVRDHLEFLQNKLDCCLVIDGESLQVRIVIFLCSFSRPNPLYNK